MQKNDYKIITEMVLTEIERAKIKYKSNFNSAHEGYAVLLEEVDELWTEVKKNEKVYDLEAQRKEAIQVAAMAIRFAAELTGGIDQPNIFKTCVLKQFDRVCLLPFSELYDLFVIKNVFDSDALAKDIAIKIGGCFGLVASIEGAYRTGYFIFTVSVDGFSYNYSIPYESVKEIV